MSRIQRLREYADPTRGPHGSSQDEAHIRYWQNRATENSDGADHRATGTERAEAHSTGKKPVDRPTSMAPKESRKVNSAMIDEDVNHVGSTYMRDVRRIS